MTAKSQPSARNIGVVVVTLIALGVGGWLIYNTVTADSRNGVAPIPNKVDEPKPAPQPDKPAKPKPTASTTNGVNPENPPTLLPPPPKN